MVRNFDIDGAEQHALSNIESSEVFLSFARNLILSKMFDSKTRGENAATLTFLQLLSKMNASCMLLGTPFAVCRP